jgi:hypothetical protein
MDPEFINETVALTRQVEQRMEVIAAYVRNHHINHEWKVFVIEARAEAGLPEPGHFVTTAHELPDFGYVVDVQPDALYFDGRNTDGHPHSYSIPVQFLFPETREQAKSEQRERYTRAAAYENERVR